VPAFTIASAEEVFCSMQDARLSTPSTHLAVATAVLAVCVFVLDTLFGVEISFSAFYTLVVLLASWFCGPKELILITAGCLALIVLSYAITVPGGIHVVGITNTSIHCGTIVLTALLVVKDKTREGMRQELARQAAELEASNKELESFAYSVSHDLRAPLRHMVGYAELLHKHSATALDDKSQHYMREIQESARRMGVLIDDLLGFSRVGRGETRKVLVSLQQLVQETVSELAEEARGREIAWKIGTLPACYGDRSMLKLVFQNLIANAIKFSRPRERAEIEIGCTAGKPTEVVVFVRDNGVGFDMRYADKLFGVFQRLHAAEDFEGTGIGLATVQRIIHRHGGEVRAEGAPDRGATFYVSLPAQGAT
jgi:signal transduction histidine kinase